MIIKKILLSISLVDLDAAVLLGREVGIGVPVAPPAVVEHLLSTRIVVAQVGRLPVDFMDDGDHHDSQHSQQDQHQ